MGQINIKGQWMLSSELVDGCSVVVARLPGLEAVEVRWTLYPGLGSLEVNALIVANNESLKASRGVLAVDHRRWGSTIFYGSILKKFVARTDVFYNGELVGEHVSGGPPYQTWGPPDQLAPSLRATIDLMASRLLASDGADWIEAMLHLRDVASECSQDRHYGEALGREWLADAIHKVQRNGDVHACVSVYRLFGNLQGRACLTVFAEALGWSGEAAYASGGTRLPESWRKPMRPCWVYVLREVDGDRVKIGRSDRESPIQRIREHQRSSSQGRELAIVAILYGDDDLERRLHTHFRKQLAPNKTEWFVNKGGMRAAVEDGFASIAIQFRARLYSSTSLELVAA